MALKKPGKLREFFLLLCGHPELPSPLFSERWYCDAWRHAVCVSATLVSAAKVMHCIQCSLVLSVFECLSVSQCIEFCVL